MSETKFSSCKRLNDLLKAERKVISDHIAEHKWFQHITDENDGIIDFIEKYGWLMREMYCGYACVDREGCKIAEKFLPEKEKE